MAYVKGILDELNLSLLDVSTCVVAWLVVDDTHALENTGGKSRMSPGCTPLLSELLQWDGLDWSGAIDERMFCEVP